MITTLKEKTKAAVVKVTKLITTSVILWIGRQRMKIGIKAAKAVHYNASKTYLDVNNKNLRNYIVLLELPVRDKKNRIHKKERLFWINRFNFRRIKRKGWMPKTIKMDELKQKAFYVSDLKRSYSEEYTAREKATNKYLSYLKSNLETT